MSTTTEPLTETFDFPFTPGFKDTTDEECEKWATALMRFWHRVPEDQRNQIILIEQAMKDGKEIYHSDFETKPDTVRRTFQLHISEPQFSEWDEFARRLLTDKHPRFTADGKLR